MLTLPAGYFRKRLHTLGIINHSHECWLFNQSEETAKHVILDFETRGKEKDSIWFSSNQVIKQMIVLGKSSWRALTCTTNRWGARNKLRLTNWDLWLSPTPPEKLIKDQIKLTIWTISLWPWAAPRCRGVSSPRLVALIRAPLCISSSTILKCPSLAAQCNGLKPWSSLQQVIGLRSQSITVNPCHSCDAGWTC